MAEGLVIGDAHLSSRRSSKWSHNGDPSCLKEEVGPTSKHISVVSAGLGHIRCRYSFIDCIMAAVTSGKYLEWIGAEVLSCSRGLFCTPFLLTEAAEPTTPWGNGVMAKSGTY